MNRAINRLITALLIATSIHTPVLAGLNLIGDYQIDCFASATSDLGSDSDSTSLEDDFLFVNVAGSSGLAEGHSGAAVNRSAPESVIATAIWTHALGEGSGVSAKGTGKVVQQFSGSGNFQFALSSRTIQSGSYSFSSWVEIRRLSDSSVVAGLYQTTPNVADFVQAMDVVLAQDDYEFVAYADAEAWGTGSSFLQQGHTAAHLIAQPVPEPATMTLLGIGLLVLRSRKSPGRPH